MGRKLWKSTVNLGLATTVSDPPLSLLGKWSNHLSLYQDMLISGPERVGVLPEDTEQMKGLERLNTGH